MPTRWTRDAIRDAYARLMEDPAVELRHNCWSWEPCCVLCSRWADDAHIQSSGHQLRTAHAEIKEWHTNLATTQQAASWDQPGLAAASSQPDHAAAQDQSQAAVSSWDDVPWDAPPKQPPVLRAAPSWGEVAVPVNAPQKQPPAVPAATSWGEVAIPVKAPPNQPPAVPSAVPLIPVKAPPSHPSGVWLSSETHTASWPIAAFSKQLPVPIFVNAQGQPPSSWTVTTTQVLVKPCAPATPPLPDSDWPPAHALEDEAEAATSNAPQDATTQTEHCILRDSEAQVDIPGPMHDAGLQVAPQNIRHAAVQATRFRIGRNLSSLQTQAAPYTQFQ